MSQLKLYRHLFGMPENYSPGTLNREELTEKIYNARKIIPFPHETLFCPKPSFTSRVVVGGEEDVIYPRNEDIIMTRTKKPADGGIAMGEGNAVAFFNGDCPIIALVSRVEKLGYTQEQTERLTSLAVLHAGFRTLIRAKKHEPNIIESAIKTNFFPVDITDAFIGFGIGPCCWVPEYEDKPEILHPEFSHHPELLASCISQTTKASPFSPNCYLSVDLYKLAKGLLIKAGISEKRILVDNCCTCCAQKDGKPLYWSHNRFKAGKQEVDGRNMAIALLTSQLESDGFENL